MVQLRLQARPGRGVQLSRWLKAVLTCHPAYLMAAPAARPHMTALYQVLEARLAMMRPLLSLTGRLELLLAQQASHVVRARHTRTLSPMSPVTQSLTDGLLAGMRCVLRVVHVATLRFSRSVREGLRGSRALPMWPPACGVSLVKKHVNNGELEKAILLCAHVGSMFDEDRNRN